MTVSKHKFQSFISDKKTDGTAQFEAYQAIKRPEPSPPSEIEVPDEPSATAYNAGFQDGHAQALLEIQRQRCSDDMFNREALRLANAEMLEAESIRLAGCFDAQIKNQCDILQNAIAQILECWLVKQAQTAAIAILVERIGEICERSTRLQLSVSGRSDLVASLADHLANLNIDVFTAPSSDSELTIYAGDTRIETCLQSIVRRIGGSSK